MSTVQPSRRRGFVLLTILLLVLVAVPVAWWCWPLSPTARSLLGTWRVQSPVSRQYDEVTFTADGRFLFRSISGRPDLPGTWRASKGELRLFTPQTPVPLTWSSAEFHVWRYLTGRVHDFAGLYAVSFDEAGQMTWSDGGSAATFSRVP